ncbi:SusC/RagA family TonB-linked outer membrane protein [Pedobacter paludis]|uniref:SusC/RagA family TonB-linked outer membrane protein n=1 Tax=Pedobacter paludis TaxID=2203212 RepID=A0A317F772_9SPHI|nr:SusC/RagA family TonB-linked outer membrane protein [Pedobacter paludis]PWS33378.1 SusC/RagA family TonB-linked outer membrane protein [Pedobacter paludis]
MKFNMFHLRLRQYWPPAKVLRIMKLTTFIMILALSQLSAKTLAQKINLQFSNTPVEKVLQQITRQTGTEFLYDSGELKNKKISVNLSGASLDEALGTMLTPLGLEYKIRDKNVVISRTEVSILDKIKNFFSDIDVRGRIVDEAGRPLAGVTIKMKTNSRGTISNANGEFSLKNVGENTLLVFSFLGRETIEMQAKEDVGQISMILSDSRLDEVEVTAYGKTTQRLTTGNQITIGSKDLEKNPVTNVLMALQGRVPGLNIAQQSGFVNAGVRYQVQGSNSILNGNDPYVLVDGVPYFSTLQGNLLDVGSSGTRANQANGSPLSFLNPSDIESVTVLKDADATAIYGSKAANGAILITTKKGASGPLKVDFQFQHGRSAPARHLDLMNTAQYLEMRREALKNDGLSLRPVDYDINGVWDNTRYTDWQKELINNSASFTQANVTLSGGTNNVTYLIGTSFNRQTPSIKGDFNDKKASMHFNLNGTSKNQKFKFQFTGSYMDDVNRLPVTDPTAVALRLAPTAPPLYNQDGSLNWMPNTSGATTFNNPVAALENTVKDQTQSLTTNVLMGYELLKAFNLTLNAGYNRLTTYQLSKLPVEANTPENIENGVLASAGYLNNRQIGWNIEPQLTYKRQTSFGNLNFLLGLTAQQSDMQSQGFSGEGYVNTAAMDDPGQASQIFKSYGAMPQLYKSHALFAQAGYNYDMRFLLNLTARRDGSSRFGANNRFHNFGAIGLGWLFSNEKWLKDNSFFSYGKMKFSYGITGNDQIANYRYLALYSSNSGDLTYGGASSLGLSPVYAIGNNDIQWEETRKLNIGLDLGFFKDRVLLSANYYLNRSSNQLLERDISSTAGATKITANLPATVQNTGLELTLNTTNLQTKSINWNTSFNLTVPRNKLVAYENLNQSSLASQYIVGESLDVRQLYPYAGVDPQTGVYTFIDHNGNRTSNPDYFNDRTVRVNVGQRFYGGIENSLSYKGFGISFLITFVRQIASLNYQAYNPGRLNINVPVSFLDRWQKPGDVATFQRYNSNNSLATSRSNLNESEGNYGDASYIRLKNLSLSYTLPEKFRNSLLLKNTRIFVQGNNLLTFTKYQGIDPETLIISMPPMRLITFGAQVSF